MEGREVRVRHHLVPGGAATLRRQVAEVVEVGGVHRPANDGLDGGLHLPEPAEVEAPEERMAPDLFRREAVMRVADEAPDEAPRILADPLVRRHLEVLSPSQHPGLRDGRVLPFVSEGRPSEQHLEGDDADGPPIALSAVRSLAVHLGPHVVRRPDRRLQLGPRRVPSSDDARGGVRPARGALVVLARLRRAVLAEAEIQEPDVPCCIQDDVVGLDIAVDVVEVGVDVVHSLHELGDVEPRLFLGEGVLAHEVRHEVAPRQVVHDHVEERVVLEGVVQAYNPGVLRQAEDVLLGGDMVRVILVHQVPLVHLLHGEHLAGVLLPAESDNAEGALTDHLDALKVGYRDLLAALPEELVLLPVEALLDLLALLFCEGVVVEQVLQVAVGHVPLIELAQPPRLLLFDRLLKRL
mmetsp:Transcript_1170/g.3092  ORF Transcript_1170/g.3092 Transcript_1170/m.3092 type:complete len:409 (-) Transcript_1170:197-1423(-)